MKILFIGGTGNISTDCASLLHRQGHDISVISRGNIPVPDEYRAIQADRKDQEALRQAIGGDTFDVVINFLGYDLADVQTDHAIFDGQVQQYIFISTAMVYAKPHHEIPITENSPLGNPYSDYAIKKLECERWLLQQHATAGFPVTIARPSHTYSKRWIPNAVSSAGYTFAARIVRGEPLFVANNGENPWTLTATTDFAVGLAGLAGNTATIGEVFHITSDEALTWNQIYAEIAAALEVPLPPVEQIPLDFICDRFPDLIGGLRGDKAEPGVFNNDKIKRFAPGFVCRKPFAEGIRESVAWLRAHPEDQKLNPQTDDLINRVVAAWRQRVQSG